MLPPRTIFLASSRFAPLGGASLWVSCSIPFSAVARRLAEVPGAWMCSLVCVGLRSECRMMELKRIFVRRDGGRYATHCYHLPRVRNAGGACLIERRMVHRMRSQVDHQMGGRDLGRALIAPAKSKPRLQLATAPEELARFSGSTTDCLPTAKRRQRKYPRALSVRLRS